MPRKWSRAHQIALERPRKPRVPTCCRRCGGRFAWTDEDGDVVCFYCNELLVCWSNYRRAMRRWSGTTEARAESTYGTKGAAA